eukprot:359707-Chlamydomonas_euryale.AAC.6
MVTAHSLFADSASERLDKPLRDTILDLLATRFPIGISSAGCHAIRKKSEKEVDDVAWYDLHVACCRD